MIGQNKIYLPRPVSAVTEVGVEWTEQVPVFHPTLTDRNGDPLKVTGEQAMTSTITTGLDLPAIQAHVDGGTFDGTLMGNNTELDAQFRL